MGGLLYFKIAPDVLKGQMCAKKIFPTLLNHNILNLPSACCNRNDIHSMNQVMHFQSSGVHCLVFIMLNFTGAREFPWSPCRTGAIL